MIQDVIAKFKTLLCCKLQNRNVAKMQIVRSKQYLVARCNLRIILLSYSCKKRPLYMHVDLEYGNAANPKRRNFKMRNVAICLIQASHEFINT